MKDHIFVGFGFGPIQGGLFAAEAFKSGRFSRIVIAEVDQALVNAIRANKGSYAINVASANGVTAQRVNGIEIYNPTLQPDQNELISALSQATEIVTSLPSVNFYNVGQQSTALLIAQGLLKSKADAILVYTAENNNHAAEILEQNVQSHTGISSNKVQFLNTVIGKMSQVVTNQKEIADKHLLQIAPGIDRAFLVEEFNKILVTRCNVPEFLPGIDVFVEKHDLLPFEEAKLYGHNAIHALLAYLGSYRGYTKMADLANDGEIMQIAQDAFIHESGEALIRKYKSLNDTLFTSGGYKAYAEDLLTRMTNPYLDDPIDRAARDPQRKLALNDRLFGTISLCLEQSVKSDNLALGAAAGISYYIKKHHLDANITAKDALKIIWDNQRNQHTNDLISLAEKAYKKLQVKFAAKY